MSKKMDISQNYKNIFDSLEVDRQILGNLIRDQRLSVGRTLTQVASVTGIDYSALSKSELSNRRIDIVEFTRICRAISACPHDTLQMFITKTSV